jgi:hypothetical protein
MDELLSMIEPYIHHCEFTESIENNWKPVFKFDVTIMLKDGKGTFRLVDLINKDHSQGFIRLTRGNHEIIVINDSLISLMVEHPVEKIKPEAL